MILAKKIAHDKWIKNVQIANKTGLAESTISNIMNGRYYPYPSQAKKIALALEYDGDIDELFKEAYDG